MSAYQSALTSVVFLDRSDRVRLEISGSDRAKFLHNLTTSDIKRLPVGQGVEAFVTSPQGKTLGFITVHAMTDRLLVRADPGGVEHVLPHLQKYGVFDDVTIEDVSGSTFEYHLAGPAAESLVEHVFRHLPEPGDLRIWITPPDEGGFIRESPLGVPGITVIGPTRSASFAREGIFRETSPEELDAATAEALRIEAGTPVFGREVNLETLPQEVARDSRAINFVKGCYLGQETVARLDALGHVNKILRGLRINGGENDVPAPGAIITGDDGKMLGKITSAAFSEGWGSPVALGYVKTSHSGFGTEVKVNLGDRTVSAVVSEWPTRRGESTE